MFLRNYWYVAAWGSELSAKPIARTILAEPIVLFRGPEGQAVALQDRCAHRRMPLSNGKVIGDTIVCCYHGLAYDFSGSCVRVPGQSVPPSNIQVRSFPLVERYGAVWLWMGDPKLANPEDIFSCDLIEEKGSGHQFYFHVKASYLYLNDNLSDLLHQAHLHNPSFGGNTEALGETAPKVEQFGDRIETKWDWFNVPVPGLFGEGGGIRGMADGWNHSVYEPPCFYINEPGFAAPNTGGYHSKLPQGKGKIGLTIYQLITPETTRTTHFFKIVSVDWPDELLQKVPSFIVPVNLEDIWACEEQQRMEDIDAKAPMHTIATDVPVAKMRRIVQRLYREEQDSESMSSAQTASIPA